MKRKKAISVIAILLAVLMVLSLFISALPLAAHADELDELRAKKDEISRQVAEIRDRIEALQEQHANVLEQKAALEEQNRLAAEQLTIIAAEIEKYDEMIRNKEKEVDAAKNREAIQLEKYRTRVRAMEENGGYNILALILESESFAQLARSWRAISSSSVNMSSLGRKQRRSRHSSRPRKPSTRANKMS